MERKDFEKNLDDAITIITRKYNDWEHENEYRFLIKSNQNKQKIGNILKIYFGNPYGNLVNTSGKSVNLLLSRVMLSRDESCSKLSGRVDNWLSSNVK